MELIEMGAQLLSDKLGLNVDPAIITGALDKLLGDGNGNIDIAALVSQMTQNGGLSSIVNSWLGDGSNSPISTDAIQSLFGEGKLSEFASSLGTDTGTAIDGLSGMLPQLVDKASSGGNLLDSVGGVGGLMDAASSLFGKK
ncbi:MAG: YidB family protein [Parahaliea sp.]